MRPLMSNTPTPAPDAFAASRNGNTDSSVRTAAQQSGHASLTRQSDHVDSMMIDQNNAGSENSIVLVGRRGSGLSSFAVIASRILDYRIVDVEANLKQKHGMGRATCIKEWGVRRFRDVATAELEAVLQQHQQRHVLLCGPEVTEPRGQALLKAFGRRHAVIMINRDVQDILRHLRLDAVPEARDILEQTQDIFRSLSNFEFFNLPEEEAPAPLAARMNRTPTETGTFIHHGTGLQSVTQDFTKFLALMRRSSYNPDQMLRPLQLESRDFSTVMSLPVARAAKEVHQLATTDCASDAIELAVDLHANKDDISRAVQNLRRLCSRPIVYHVQWQPEGSPADEQKYTDLFRHGLRLLPEYITIDLHCAPVHLDELASEASGSKIIAHRHFASSEPCPWDLSRKFPHARQATALGCVAARFVRDTRSPLEDRDCVQFQVIVNNISPISVSATNIGCHAKSSLVSNPIMTPVVQPGLSLVNPEELLLAQDQLLRARFSSHAYQALHFHLFGSSIVYSLSPIIHSAAFDFLGMQHTYQARQTHRIGDLWSLVDDTCGGVSVTLPFKSEVIPMLDTMSDAARVIQAINTIIPKRHGADAEGSDPLSRCHRNKAGPITGLHGENTDWIALRTCISRHLSTANSITPSTSALVIGAGGMAKAAIYALIQLGVQHIFLWNRTLSKANKVAEHFNKLMRPSTPTARPRIQVLPSLNTPWPEPARQPSIVACTPPVHEIDGAPGLDFEVPLPWFQSPTGGVIVELSYKTPWTRLMQQAHENAHRGWKCVEPLEILIEQGCAQFEVFTGYPAPKKRMTECVVMQFSALHSASNRRV